MPQARTRQARHRRTDVLPPHQEARHTEEAHQAHRAAAQWEADRHQDTAEVRLSQEALPTMTEARHLLEATTEAPHHPAAARHTAQAVEEDTAGAEVTVAEVPAVAADTAEAVRPAEEEDKINPLTNNDYEKDGNYTFADVCSNMRLCAERV